MHPSRALHKQEPRVQHHEIRQAIVAYFEVWDALVGLPGVKHAKGHLRHQADIVMALKSETQLLQAVCHNLWSGPATLKHVWQHFMLAIVPALAFSGLGGLGRKAQNSPASSFCQLDKQSCKGKPLMIRQLL